MTDDLKHISKYLDNLDKQVEQWSQETTVDGANNKLGYMTEQPNELNETIRELDEKISKTKGDAAKRIVMELKWRAEIHQQQIKDRVERINNHLFRLTELKGKVIQLAGEMESIASDIKISFANDNPKNEKSAETLDKTLKRKADELREWMKENLKDFLYPWGDADLDFEIRNMISIRHVLGNTFDGILRRLRLHPKYETYNKNADLAKPLEEKRNDVLSYLDELEGKTTPEILSPSKTRPEDMAEMLTGYAENITKALNKFAHRQDDPELARLYISYSQLLEVSRKSAKKLLKKDLPDLPTLNKSNCYIGMINLADYCKNCAAILMGKTGISNGEQKKPAGTGQMDGKELKDFLLETAQKVSTRIIDEVVMKRFQEQDKAFYDDYQEWYRENEQYLKEIGVRDKETKEAREKRISKISPPRPCPLDLLTIPDHHTDPHILHLVESIVPKERHEQKFSSEEIMKADYVFLTVLHDKALKDTRHFNPINTDIWPQDEEWAEHLWQRMMEESSGWKPEFLLNELNDTLENVETDLAKLSAETEQKTEPQEKDEQSETHDIPTLTEDEAQVLNYLNDEHPQIRYQQDIVAVCKRDRKTIRACLKKLMECGFVSLPEGKKKGYVITSDGKDYLDKHF